MRYLTFTLLILSVIGCGRFDSNPVVISEEVVEVTETVAEVKTTPEPIGETENEPETDVEPIPEPPQEPDIEPQPQPEIETTAETEQPTATDTPEMEVIEVVDDPLWCPVTEASEEQQDFAREPEPEPVAEPEPEPEEPQKVQRYKLTCGGSSCHISKSDYDAISQIIADYNRNGGITEDGEVFPGDFTVEVE